MTTARTPQRNHRNRAGTNTVLALLSGAVAVWAVAGSAGLVTGALDLGVTAEARLPMHSPVLGGVALLLIVGVPMATTSVLATRGDQRAGAVAVVAGAALVGWIVVQLCIIQTFSWLQPACVSIGLAVLAIGLRRTWR